VLIDLIIFCLKTFNPKMDDVDDCGIELADGCSSSESRGTLIQFQAWGFDSSEAVAMAKRYTELADGKRYRKTRKKGLCFVAILDVYKQMGKIVCPKEIETKLGLSENKVCQGLRLYNESSQSIYSRLDWSTDTYTFHIMNELGRKTASNTVIIYRLFEFLESLRVESHYKRSKPICVALGILYFHFSNAIGEDPIDIQDLSERYGCSDNTIEKISDDIANLVETYV